MALLTFALNVGSYTTVQRKHSRAAGALFDTRPIHGCLMPLDARKAGLKLGELIKARLAQSQPVAQAQTPAIEPVEPADKQEMREPKELAPQITVNVPDIVVPKPEPVQVTVNVPEGQDAPPVINVAAPNVTVEAPVTVNVPEQAAPIINVTPELVFNATIPDIEIPSATFTVDLSSLDARIEAMAQVAALDREMMIKALGTIAAVVEKALSKPDNSAAIMAAMAQTKMAVESLEAATLAPRKSIITRDGSGNITAAESRPVLN
jgi:hypothetical protein